MPCRATGLSLCGVQSNQLRLIALAPKRLACNRHYHMPLYCTCGWYTSRHNSTILNTTLLLNAVTYGVAYGSGAYHAHDGFCMTSDA